MNILLTGSPGVGKSSLARNLADHYPKDVVVADFGQILVELLKEKIESYEMLRSDSGHLVTHEDVNLADEILLEILNKNQDKKLVLIDSHAVTRENFGYRVTMSSIAMLEKLRLGGIFMIESNPRIQINRVKNNPAGRIEMTESQLNIHHSLQRSVVVAYGFQLNIPIFIFENNRSIHNLAKDVEEGLSTLGITLKKQ